MQKINIKIKIIQKIEIIHPIINRKKKINIEIKNEVVIKNMNEIEKKKDIIIMVIRDIQMINIKSEIEVIEIIEIIIVEVRDIRNIKMQDQVIVHHQNIISKDHLRILLHTLALRIQKKVHIQVRKKKILKKIIIPFNRMYYQIIKIRAKNHFLSPPCIH